MKVIVHKEYDVENCAQCPHVRVKPCQHSPVADDYHCGATPDDKKIAGYVEWDDQLPKTPPDWCPYMNGGATV